MVMDKQYYSTSYEVTPRVMLCHNPVAGWVAGPAAPCPTAAVVRLLPGRSAVVDPGRTGVLECTHGPLFVGILLISILFLVLSYIYIYVCVVYALLLWRPWIPMTSQFFCTY